MSSRDGILAAVRAAGHAAVERPVVPVFPVAGDPVENFIAKLEGFDGRCLRFDTRAEAEALAEAKKRQAVRDEFGQPDVWIAEGLMGVGETGSVWVTAESLGSTCDALFSKELYLLLPQSAVVPSLQEAYRRIDLASLSYGSFLNGPSATADIEAIHISGAQAYKELTVLLYAEAAQ